MTSLARERAAVAAGAASEACANATVEVRTMTELKNALSQASKAFDALAQVLSVKDVRGDDIVTR